jgi:hypothetical protein
MQKSPGSAEAKCKNHRLKYRVADLIFDTQVIRPHSSAVCSSQTSNKPNILMVEMSTCYSTSSQALKKTEASTGHDKAPYSRAQFKNDFWPRKTPV